MFGVLLRAKTRAIANYARSGEGGWRRLVVFSVLGVAIWVGILLGSLWLLGKVVAIEPIGMVMMRKLLGLVLLFLIAILTVSNLIGAFSTFFLADDLQLLIPRPIPSYSLYSARVAENTVHAAWMTLSFATPFFVAAGVVVDAGVGYYATLGAVLVALAVLPGSISVALCLVLGVLFSARRTRQVLLVVATFVLGVLLVLFRNLEPERFLNPDEREPLLAVLGRLQTGEASWLPSTWASDALWSHLGLSTSGAEHPLALLLAGSAAAFFVSGWMFRALYTKAFSRAQDGILPDRREAARRRRAGVDVAARIGRVLHGSGPDSMRRTMLKKDLLVFVRDTTQWSQAFLIAVVVVIYVVNFKYIRTAGESGIISAAALHFINLALGGFVAVAVCVRFAFPAVSLEGRAFWIILCSPNRMMDFLVGKWISLAVPLSALVGLLVVITNLWLGSGWALTIAAAVTVMPLTTGLTGLALGLGARYPRFGIDNAAKIATGFGGVLYMFGGLFLLVVVVLLSIQPTWVAATWLSHGLVPGPARGALAFVLALCCIGLPLVCGRVAVRVGARHLDVH